MNTETFGSFVNEFLNGDDDNVSEGGEPKFLQKSASKKAGNQKIIFFRETDLLYPLAKTTPSSDIKGLINLIEKCKEDQEKCTSEITQREPKINKAELYEKFLNRKAYSIFLNRDTATLVDVASNRQATINSIAPPNFKKLLPENQLSFISAAIKIAKANINNKEDTYNKMDELTATIDKQLMLGGKTDLIFGKFPGEITFKPKIENWMDKNYLKEFLDQLNGKTTPEISFDSILVLDEQNDIIRRVYTYRS